MHDIHGYVLHKSQAAFYCYLLQFESDDETIKRKNFAHTKKNAKIFSISISVVVDRWCLTIESRASVEKFLMDVKRCALNFYIICN